MNAHGRGGVDADGPPFRAWCECGWSERFDDWLKAHDAVLTHLFGPAHIDLPPVSETTRREIYIRAAPITSDEETSKTTGGAGGKPAELSP